MAKDDYYNLMDNKYAQVLIGLVYVVIFVFGLAGNLRVGHSVLREKSKQTVTNVFIANLAVANILLCLFIVPYYMIDLFVRSWPLGSFMWHLLPCIYYSTCFASVLTLASMAQMRCWLTVHQLEEQVNRRKMIISIVVIWLVSIAFSLPYGIFSTVYERNGVTYRSMDWPTFDDYRNYITTTLIVMVVLPLVFIAYCFIAMSKKISRMSATDSVTQIGDRNRTNRLLIALFTVYAICWLPIFIYVVLIETHKNEWENIEWKYIWIVYRIFEVMSMSWTCFNPAFYMWLNKITIKQFCLVGPCFRHGSLESSNEEVAPSYTALENRVTYTAHCDTGILISVE